MKRILVLAFVGAALSVPAAQAAAPPKGPTMKQFNALKAQLVKDEKTIKSLDSLISGLIGLVLCQNALNADAFQGTWQAVDTLAVSLAKPAVFGPQTTAVTDANACSDLSAGKVVRSHAVPPTVSVFSSFATLLTG
jgi:hypothetical protein